MDRAGRIRFLLKRLQILLALGGLLAVHAGASVVYSNGPLAGGPPNSPPPGGAWEITNFLVTDSFTVSQVTAYGFTFGAWLFPTDTVQTVDWAIGTGAYGNDIASGTAVLSSAYQFTNIYGVDIYIESGALPNVALSAGAYWFTLTNAVTSLAQSAYWDENDGPSTAFDSGVGDLANGDGSGCANGQPTCTGSETFEILGTPEPGTLGLLGGGVLMVAGLLRRKLRG